MASILNSEVRKGMVVKREDGQLYYCVDRELRTPGNLPSKLTLKLKNMKTGFVNDVRVHPDDKIEQAYLDKREMQYLYKDADGYVFMDTETYDQLSFNPDILGTSMQYLLPNSKVVVQYVGGKPVSVDVPASVDLTVTETPPSLKGATATNQYKEALLETGLKVQVPPFIGPGEKIRIDTRTGEYVERVK